ncbi:hypothetical protein TVAGG3_0246880, partial [Trichomonas vaginalis G3]
MLINDLYQRRSFRIKLKKIYIWQDLPPRTSKSIPESAIIDITTIKWNNIPQVKNHTFFIKDDFPFTGNANQYQEFCNTNVNRIYHLRDCFFSGNSAIIYNKTYLDISIPNQEIASLYSLIPGQIVGSHDVAIYLGHGFCHIYGHFIEDALSPLMQLPNEILKKATIVMCTDDK